ncbi:hypothetical protein PV779_46595, partial [Streptomyces sp. ID01-9D]|nr:hypothetical protein [Streptomyces sp. ID01-9D]
MTSTSPGRLSGTRGAARGGRPGRESAEEVEAVRTHVSQSSDGRPAPPRISARPEPGWGRLRAGRTEGR